MAEPGNHPVIIKRVKKIHGGGHHGGNWKVAYADFTTAMMAFFLMLWLLNAVTEEQMQGIAHYFSPTALSNTKSGAGGVLGGTSMLSPGPMQTVMSAPGATVSLLPLDPKEQPDIDGLPAEKPPSAEAPAAETPTDGASDEAADEAADGAADEAALEADLEAVRQRLEQQEFERAEAALRAAVAATPELREFSRNLLIDMTAQGMRIQIADAEQRSMFALGSSDMFPHTQVLLEKIVQAISGLPNDVAVVGHTDATPYRTDNGYTNWELSTDRANASRRALVAAGLPASRIVRIVGRADHDPLIKNDAFAAQNRRISILLLRESSHRQGG